MARKKLIQSSSHPYHITVRTNSGTYFGLPGKRLWTIFNDYLRFLTTVFDAKIHAFVMMSNHLHLLASFPCLNISLAMNRFMTESARALNFEMETSNHVYGRRYFACLVESDKYYACVYRYIFQNPIRAGICKRVEEYPYSTLAGLLGQIPLTVPVLNFPNPFVPEIEDLEMLLEYLNREIPKNTVQATRKALHKTQFQYSGRYLEWAKTHHANGAPLDVAPFRN